MEQAIIRVGTAEFVEVDQSQMGVATLKHWIWSMGHEYDEIKDAPYLLVTGNHSLQEDQRLMRAFGGVK